MYTSIMIMANRVRMISPAAMRTTPRRRSAQQQQLLTVILGPFVLSGDAELTFEIFFLWGGTRSRT